ncbi:hypothetical protein SAMN04488056_103299 [Cohaesibacter marisflavi]|uniref:Uncharacterized protein n=1 Tax=Cohaesibacter marisflavi TaxID=655353 RepID=A0A1I5EQT1_9HYPH|nr:hypothetical protein SAMN04488056_103299 [Cohaesibacter marisflavi]
MCDSSQPVPYLAQTYSKNTANANNNRQSGFCNSSKLPNYLDSAFSCLIGTEFSINFCQEMALDRIFQFIVP